MHFPLQIALGQAVAILFTVGLSVLSLSILVEVGDDVSRGAGASVKVSEAVHEVTVALLSYEDARRAGPTEALAREKGHLTEALQSLYRVTGMKGDDAALLDLEARVARFLEGKRPSAEMKEVVDGLAMAEQGAIAGSIVPCVKQIQSDLGLVAILGGLGLLSALLVAYWLTRRVAYPLERIAGGAEAVAAGDLHRRLTQPSMLHLIGRLSGSIDQLADRLQRIENDRRLDFLLVSAALERLLGDRVGACGLLSPGKRLIVGNVEARRLVEARGRSYDAIVEEYLETKPESVERWPLLDRDSVVLGELVTVRGEATP